MSTHGILGHCSSAHAASSVSPAPLQTRVVFQANGLPFFLEYSSIKGLQAHLQQTDGTERAVHLSFPFPIVSSAQLSKLAPHIAEYGIHLSSNDAGEFKLTFWPQLLGGGNCLPCLKKKKTGATQPLLDKSPEQNGASTSSRPSVSVSSPPSSASVVRSDQVHPNEQEDVSALPAARPRAVSLIRRFSILSTQALAQELKARAAGNDRISEDTLDLEGFALRIVNTFGLSYQGGDPALVEELAFLPKAGYLKINKQILHIIAEKIRERRSHYDAPLWNALRDTLLFTERNLLDPNDLVQILGVIQEAQKGYHSQASNQHVLYQMLCTLSEILDAMVDANVVRVNFDVYLMPLFEELDHLSSSRDFRVSIKAAYAKEALVRVGHDQGKLSTVICIAKGIVKTMGVVIDQDPTGLIEAYEQFKVARIQIEGRHAWYEELRFCKALFGDRGVTALRKFLTNSLLEMTPQDHLYFMGGLVDFLFEYLHQKADAPMGRQILDLIISYYQERSELGRLSQIFKRDARELCGKMKVGILKSLSELCKNGTAPLASESKRALETILHFAQTSAERDAELENFRQAGVPQDLSQISDAGSPLQTDRANSGELFTRTLGQRSSTQQLFESMQRKRIEAQEGYLTTYISPDGYQDSCHSRRINLFELIQTFLGSAQKVLLLQGDAGAGKTTFLRSLEVELWRRWNPGQPIPLFIELKTLREPLAERLEKELAEYEFENHEIKGLKNFRRFLLLLDGFDEMLPQAKRNFYQDCSARGWKDIQVIVSGRTNEMGVQDKELLTPRNPSLQRHANELFQELWIAGFSIDQRDRFLSQYREKNQSAWTIEEGHRVLDQMPDELPGSPFWLYLIADSMRKLLNTPPGNDIRNRVYQAFTETWFDREATKLEDMLGRLPGNIKVCFLQMSKALAYLMDEIAGVGSISYTPPPYGQEDRNPWRGFMGCDREIWLVRRGVPLRQIQQGEYAFIHDDILQYFASEANFDEGENPYLREPYLNEQIIGLIRGWGDGLRAASSGGQSESAC